VNAKLFRNPPSKYRSAPFWSWNDKLTDAELVRQIRSFHSVGIGGFFMHSRVGLMTPYLSKEWMDRIKTTVREAERLGMKARLYDEDSYPSGFAGGIVPSLGAAYRAKSLHHELTAERPTMRDGTVAIFRCRVEDGRPVSATRDDGLPAAPGEQFLHFFWAVQGNATWYNDTSYIDTLNRDAADAFLAVTHDAYAREVGDHFGDTIPCMFTDEPRLPGGWSWTENLAAEFSARKGYDIRDHMPALLYRIGDDWARVRYDYWDVVTALFLENLCKPMFDWCREHKIALTGHFWEHSYPDPTIMGDMMAPYTYEQIPGIDCLGFSYGNRTHPQFGYVPMCKEVSSIAHQFGRPQVLCEAYGGAGWDFSFANQKWYWDWHLVLGVNLLCQHLSLYSLRGCRKRDFPPSFMDYQPWWPHYKVLGDYVGRMGYALSQGAFAADVLVLHPCEGSWIEYSPLEPEWYQPRRKAAFDALWDLTQALTELKCEFDMGSEWVLADRGRVRDGQLCVGKGTYRTVVLPRMVSLRGSTLDLLSEFVEAGGTVVVTGDTPTYLDGAHSRIVESFFKRKFIVRSQPTRPALAKCLAKVAPPTVTVADAKGRNIPAIYIHRRLVRNAQILFLASMDTEKTYKATVTLPGSGAVEVYDALTGDVQPMAAQERGGKLVVDLEFPPNASHLLRVGKPARGGQPILTAPAKPSQRLALKPSWDKKRLGPNALVLDLCKHRIGTGRWSARLPIHHAQRAARERFGFEWDSNNRGTQFWKAYQGMKDLGPDARVKLRYEFTSQLSPEAARSVKLVVEVGDRFEARVNGKAVAFDGWWRERSFRTAAIGHLVRKGTNTVELAIDFRQDVELEASFLIGDFAVEPKADGFVLVDETPGIRTGDWTQQGYPFYADAMVYEQTVTLDAAPAEARLCFDKLDAIVTRVLVNGNDAGLVFTHPLSLDVAEHLRPGDNQIAIEVYPSLRNLLGPLHFGGTQGDMTGPGHFFADWTDAYRLAPYGIAGKVWLETGEA